MTNDKIKISQKEFNDIYDIIEDNTIETETIKTETIKTEEEPEFLTEEEQGIDDKMFEDYPVPKEDEDASL